MELFKHETADTIQLLQLLHKNLKLVVFAVLAGACLATLVTFLQTPKFISTAAIYPGLTQVKGDSMEIQKYGRESDVQRVLQILDSRKLIDSVAGNFGLYQYYHLKKNNPNDRKKLESKFRKDVRFHRSTFGSIVISSINKDPDIARGITEYITRLVDSIQLEIFKKNISSQSTIEEITSVPRVYVIDDASVGVSVSPPNYLQNLLIGGMLSFLFVSLFLIIRQYGSGIFNEIKRR